MTHLSVKDGVTSASGIVQGLIRVEHKKHLAGCLAWNNHSVDARCHLFTRCSASTPPGAPASVSHSHPPLSMRLPGRIHRGPQTQGLPLTPSLCFLDCQHPNACSAPSTRRTQGARGCQGGDPATRLCHPANELSPDPALGR